MTAAEGKRNGAGSAGSTIPLVSGRSRAEQDSVVRRLQEKFGAEIRTVIDYKESVENQVSKFQGFKVSKPCNFHTLKP